MMGGVPFYPSSSQASAVEQGPLPLGASIEEARAFMRMGAGIDDAVLAGLVRSATAVCEQFVNHAIVARAVQQVLAINADWQRLALCPVSAITSVQGVPAEGSAFIFPVTDYAIDIDSGGNGWVRVINQGAAGRMRVAYSAGMVASEGEVPDALRQGIIMLAAHLHRARDGDDANAPPAAISALWQPWRRMRLS